MERGEADKTIGEIVNGLFSLSWAVGKFVIDTLLSLPWWMAVMVVGFICFIGFLLYQQGEHMGTSFITKALVWMILMVVVVFGVLAFMNASGGIPGI